MTPETLMAVGGATRGIGDVAAGIGGYKTSKYNARTSEIEAEAARQQGVLAQESAEEASRFLEKGRIVSGEQRVAAAASGVDVNRGSPLLAVLDTIIQSHEDAVSARIRGDYQAWQAENEAWASEVSAQQEKWAGKRTLLSGLTRGFGDFSQGLFMSNWMKKNKI